ncbi:MAG: TM1266 family iron-only hydrogenase system putative regulator [Candidatus Omnitrophota bacterium]
MDKRVGFVGIILENREEKSAKVNEIISRFADMIVARTGVPYKQRNCCVITLVAGATTDKIGDLTGRLGAIQGVSVKSGLSKSR